MRVLHGCKKMQRTGGRDPAGNPEGHPLPRLRPCGRIYGSGGSDGCSVR